MTANEIRDWHKAFERQDVTAEVARARARIEIAAQLAELNENIANLRNQLDFANMQNRSLRVRVNRYERILGMEEQAA